MMKVQNRFELRQLPSVDRVLDWASMGRLIGLYGRSVVRDQVRAVLEDLRDQAKAGQLENTVDDQDLCQAVARRVEQEVGGRFRRVLNATGIALHTNLGRAPLPSALLARLAGWSDAGCNLELDLASGVRGERNFRIERLLALLTGCEAAIAVNNNAGSLVLALRVLASRRRVLLSRGEMVEIGGSFRVPEILKAAGCELVEVGTTNRTRLDDYERAIDDQTALLLRVYPSNYRIRGFTEAVGTAELVALGKQHGVPVLVDEGSGLLRPRPEAPFADHDSVLEAICAGADLVCSSADKVLGGPQAGLLVGRADLVAACRRDPLYRALRPGRLIFAVLEETLRRELVGAKSAVDRLWPDPIVHEARVRRVAAELAGSEVVTVDGFVGGGAAPDIGIAAAGIALPFEEGWARALRLGEPPVVVYQQGGRMLVDLRTVAPDDDEALIAALKSARPTTNPGTPP